ncbi:MAG: glycosyl transferase group 1 [Proteobacteria bacterium]|nr:glycosyl transferase group 1 [Pseudomonadota bacterium]
MRIAWCSPLSRQSGVSKFSLAVVKALSAIAEVDYWCEELEDNYAIDFVPVRALRPDDQCAAELRAYDAVVFNMGNNAEFHYAIYWLSTRVKGVVILHDKFMHHFFAGHYLNRLQSMPAYALAIRQYYGSQGMSRALRAIRRSRPVWETEEIADFPFFEPALWNASGLIVHSRDAMGKVSGSVGLIPAKVMHHPFYLADFEYGDRPFLSRRDLGVDEDRLLILSHGFINPNKRIDKVIEAIAADPSLKDRVQYVVAGGWVFEQTADYLRNLASKHGLSERVRLTGYIDDHTMHSYLHHADICLNLRYPSIESSSGSLVEQLYFGKPVVVTRIGAYDEVPDDCVVKINMDDEQGNLRRALEQLVGDEDYRRQVAAAGHAWAQENCSAQNYASQLLDFLARIGQERDTLDFVDGIADTLSAFLHPGLRNEYARAVADEVQSIIG